VCVSVCLCVCVRCVRRVWCVCRCGVCVCGVLCVCFFVMLFINMCGNCERECVCVYERVCDRLCVVYVGVCVLCLSVL